MAKHIILDIDGTLIDSIPPNAVNEDIGEPLYKIDGYCIYKRPHLDKFIEFCFSNFQTVSIWTASDNHWANAFVKNAIPEKYQKRFTFIFDERRCTRKYIQDGFYMNPNLFKSIKNLGKFWRCSKYRNMGISKDNTIIIDDTPSTFMNNYGNGIQIPTFEILLNKNDDYLKNLCIFLKWLIDQEQSVRLIEKRQWWQRIKDGKYEHCIK